MARRRKSMTRTKHDLRSEATRQQLATAARALFGARGYAGVGTEEIVRAAGVTRGALYHQFRDKADLFAAVAEEVEAEIAERIAAGVAGPRRPLRSRPGPARAAVGDGRRRARSPARRPPRPRPHRRPRRMRSL